MSLKNEMIVDDSSPDKGIVLWEPIAFSQYSKLGLYNDDRFPGRSILAARAPFRSIDEPPMDYMMGFMRDIQIGCLAIKLATRSPRVNVCFLSNRDPFLHAHLIPRFPEMEKYPDRSPWDDPRPKGKMSLDTTTRVKAAIWRAICEVDARSDSDDY